MSASKKANRNLVFFKITLGTKEILLMGWAIIKLEIAKMKIMSQEMFN